MATTNTKDTQAGQRTVDRAQLVSRITKLLALAENNSNQNEARAAEAKAMELMSTAGLSLDDLEKEKITMGRFEMRFSRPPEWYTALYCEVCRWAGVFVAYSSGSGTTGRFYMAGFREDVDNAQYLCEVLDRQIEDMVERHAALVYFTTRKRLTGVQRNSYRLGLVQGLSARLGRLARRVMSHKGDQSAALTLVEANKKKYDLAEAWAMDRMKIVTADRNGEVDWEQIHAGRAASDAIAVNPAVTQRPVEARALLA